MDGRNSEDPKQNTDVTAFVQNLLKDMQSKFQAMSDSILVKIDDMGSRINELEQSINELKAEMGADGSPSPTAPSETKEDEVEAEDKTEVKTEEGSA